MRADSHGVYSDVSGYILHTGKDHQWYMLARSHTKSRKFRVIIHAPKNALECKGHDTQRRPSHACDFMSMRIYAITLCGRGSTNFDHYPLSGKLRTFTFSGRRDAWCLRGDRICAAAAAAFDLSCAVSRALKYLYTR